jgi:hypothetical protein
VGAKGRDEGRFRGGRQRARDPWYGYDDKEFQRWAHGEKQKTGMRRNMTKGEIEELWKEWEGLHNKEETP